MKKTSTIFRKLASGALAWCAFCTAAIALDDGTYEVSIDGGQGEIVVDDGVFSITIATPDCIGTGTGPITRQSNSNNWVAQLTETGSEQVCFISGNSQTFFEVQGCSYFRGMQCSFDGTVVGLRLPQDDVLIDSVLSALPPERLMLLQHELNVRDFYDAEPDGIYGPQTRAAFLSAARYAATVSSTPAPDLSSQDGILELVNGLIATIGF